MDRVDQVGKLLFGRSLRLRVLIWVLAQEDHFFKSEAASGIGYSSVNAVIDELDRLVELEMVRVVVRDDTTKRHYFERKDHPFWNAIRSIAENV